MTVWYKINPNRFTYRELWRAARRRPWPFAKAVCRKWFNVPYRATIGFAFPETLEFVDYQQLPERPRQSLGDMILQAEKLGFRFLFCWQRSTLGETKDYSAVLLSQDESTLASAMWVTAGSPNASTRFALGSRGEGRRLITSNSDHVIDGPPEIKQLHFPGKSIDEIATLHSLRIDRRGLEQIQNVTEREAVGRIIENQQCTLAFNLARGVYVPLTQEEVERLSGPVTAEVVAESANPFRAPREDDTVTRESHIASPIANRSWQAPVIAGFVVAALIAEFDSWNNGFDVLRMHLFTWLYICIAYVAWPVAIGMVGAAVGLAVWFIRRAFWRLIP